MATAFKIQVTQTETGLLNWKQTEATAKKVTELLQKDLESHHVFFNTSGFHNHIPHHILALYGTGADSAVLDQAFDSNASYQIRAMKPHTEIIGELRSDYPANARKYFSKGKHYPDFLLFFQEQIAEKGWEETLKEYLFKGDDLADELFGRLYAGFLHPIIQLMYGVEWKQPAIIAEGLAQAAVHDNRLGEYLLKVEAAAKSKNNDASSQRTLPEICESIRKVEKLAKSVHYGDKSNIFDGMVARAPDEAFELLSNIAVDPNRLEEQTAEMAHTAAYICAASAFRPPYIPKFDFFLIHHLNSSPIFVAFNELSWIPLETKARLLEWKMRVDAVQYVARGCPLLNFDNVKSYKPRDVRMSKAELVSKPADLVPRFYPIPDDGHTIKVVRALLLAQKLTEKYANAAEPPAWLRIADNDTWLRIHYALLDSVQDAGQEGRYVRSAGFDEAWTDVPKL